MEGSTNCDNKTTAKPWLLSLSYGLNARNRF